MWYCFDATNVHCMSICHTVMLKKLKPISLTTDADCDVSASVCVSKESAVHSSFNH